MFANPTTDNPTIDSPTKDKRSILLSILISFVGMSQTSEEQRRERFSKQLLVDVPKLGIVCMCVCVCVGGGGGGGMKRECAIRHNCLSLDQQTLYSMIQQITINFVGLSVVGLLAVGLSVVGLANMNFDDPTNYSKLCRTIDCRTIGCQTIDYLPNLLQQYIIVSQ